MTTIGHRFYCLPVDNKNMNDFYCFEIIYFSNTELFIAFSRIALAIDTKDFNEVVNELLFNNMIFYACKIKIKSNNALTISKKYLTRIDIETLSDNPFSYVGPYKCDRNIPIMVEIDNTLNNILRYYHENGNSFINYNENNIMHIYMPFIFTQEYQVFNNYLLSDIKEYFEQSFDYVLNEELMLKKTYVQKIFKSNNMNENLSKSVGIMFKHKKYTDNDYFSKMINALIELNNRGFNIPVTMLLQCIKAKLLINPLMIFGHGYIDKKINTVNLKENIETLMQFKSFNDIDLKFLLTDKYKSRLIELNNDILSIINLEILIDRLLDEKTLLGPVYNRIYVVKYFRSDTVLTPIPYILNNI